MSDQPQTTRTLRSPDWAQARQAAPRLAQAQEPRRRLRQALLEPGDWEDQMTAVIDEVGDEKAWGSDAAGNYFARAHQKYGAK